MNSHIKYFFSITAIFLCASFWTVAQAQVATAPSLSVPTSTATSTQKSVVYHIISGVSTTTATTTITVNTLTSRNQYDCNVLTYACQFLKENVSVRDEKAFEEITVVPKKYEDIIPNNLRAGIVTVVATTTSTSSIPVDAKYITPSVANTYTAYYTTPIDTVKKTRTYSVLNSISKKTISRTEPIVGWDLVADPISIFGWSKDETKLVYLSDRDGAPALYKVDMSENQQSLVGERITHPRYSVEEFIVYENTVYFIANRKSAYVWGLYSLSFEKDSKVETISEDVAYTNSIQVIGNTLLYNVSKKGVSQLYGYDISSNTSKPFTGLPEYTVTTYPTKEVSIGNQKALFIEPVKKGKKVIIWLHGGPYRQSAIGRHPYPSYGMYDWMLDTAISKNVSVLKLDYPGSFGFGSDYAQSIRTKVGDIDMVSLKKAITFLNKKGYTEVYLFGNSYGGYVTAKGVVELGKKVAGGVAVAPVTDWKKLVEQVSPTPFETHFNGIPSDANQILYTRANISDTGEKMISPLVLVHGDKDTQVPYNQSEYLYTTLAEYGKPVTFFKAIGQNHVFRGVSQIESLCSVLMNTVGVVKDASTCVLQ